MKKVIELNLNAAQLSQSLLDRIVAEATGNYGLVDIVIKNVSTVGGGIPRLILDYGQLYKAVELLLAERDEEKQSISE